MNIIAKNNEDRHEKYNRKKKKDKIVLAVRKNVLPRSEGSEKDQL